MPTIKSELFGLRRLEELGVDPRKLKQAGCHIKGVILKDSRDNSRYVRTVKINDPKSGLSIRAGIEVLAIDLPGSRVITDLQGKRFSFSIPMDKGRLDAILDDQTGKATGQYDYPDDKTGLRMSMAPGQINQIVAQNLDPLVGDRQGDQDPYVDRLFRAVLSPLCRK